MLKNVVDRSFEVSVRLAERFTGGAWPVKATLLALAASLFFAFPSYDALIDGTYDSAWDALREKFANPLLDMGHYGTGGESHEANLTFRLTVPVIAYVLRLGVGGAVALAFVGGVLVFAVTALITERITGDRVSAIFAALMLALISPGIHSFIEMRGNFDGVCLLLALLAILWRNPVLIASTLFAALWTDERGFIAAAFVWLYYIVEANPGRSFRWGSLLRREALAIYGACAAYAVLRVVLTTRLGLTNTLGGAGPVWLIRDLNMVPMGAWTGFEGGWLIIGLGAVALWRQGARLLPGGYVLSIGLLIFAAMCTFDITRTMAFGLPLFFVAMLILARHDSPEGVRFAVWVAFAVSLLWLTYEAGGEKSIAWAYPLPLQIVRWLALWLIPGTPGLG